MQYFPVFMDLRNKAVLVVGGGDVACRKIEALYQAGAKITIVSPHLHPILKTWVDEKKCNWHPGFYTKKSLHSKYCQVWATTNNPELNHQVYQEAKQLGLLVNVVDDPDYCDFITPARLERGRIQLALSSGGASPILIRNLRAQLETLLPQNLGLIADFTQAKRQEVKKNITDSALRRQFWENFLHYPQVQQAAHWQELEACYHTLLTQPSVKTAQVIWVEWKTDIELLPIKAVAYMQKADLILIISHAPEELLNLCRRDADRLYIDSPDTLAKILSDNMVENNKMVILIPESIKNYDQFSRMHNLKPASEIIFS